MSLTLDEFGNELGRPEDAIDHEALIDQVAATLPSTERIDALSALFKMFGDQTRARILYALSASELRVYDIVAILGLSQSSISHQLRLLRGAKLVKARQSGKEIYYSLADQHVMTIFQQALAHTAE